MKAVSLLLTILTAYGTVVVNSDLSVNNKHTSILQLSELSCIVILQREQQS